VSADKSAALAKRLAEEVKGHQGQVVAALQKQQAKAAALQEQLQRATLERTSAQEQLEEVEKKVGRQVVGSQAGCGLELEFAHSLDCACIRSSSRMEEGSAAWPNLTYLPPSFPFPVFQAVDLEAKLTSSAKQWEALQQRAAELEAEVGAAGLLLPGPVWQSNAGAGAGGGARSFVAVEHLFGSPTLLPCPPGLPPHLPCSRFPPAPLSACSWRPPSSSSTSCRGRTPR
jgi:hypothetical protein